MKLNISDKAIYKKFTSIKIKTKLYKIVQNDTIQKQQKNCRPPAHLGEIGENEIGNQIPPTQISWNDAEVKQINKQTKKMFEVIEEIREEITSGKKENNYNKGLAQ